MNNIQENFKFEKNRSNLKISFERISFVFLNPKQIVLDVKIIVIMKNMKKINDIRSKDIFKFDLFASNLKFSSVLFIIKFKNF